MNDYKTTKKIKKIEEIIIDVLLFSVRCICTPIYKISEKKKKEKRYTDKEIRKTIQYLIDYWTDGQSELYVILDDDYNPFDYDNVTTPYHMEADMSWGWHGENKKVKNKSSHIYHYQKEQYLNIFKELCNTPMTLEEKKQWFDTFDISKVKDRIVCKLK